MKDASDIEKAGSSSDEAFDQASDVDVVARQSKQELIKEHLVAPVKTDRAYLLMLVCCLCTGIVDSTLYNAYGTFVSMQTGNTIFVALGASNQNNKPYGWARSLISIVCFMFGAVFFSRVNKFFGGKKRVTLAGSFLTQAVFIFVAAALNESGVINGNVPPLHLEWNQVAPIALLSFQAAGQIVGSRAVGVNEIPTVVITSMISDLFSDLELLKVKNDKRNRRVVAFSLTLIGAIAGGWISKATGFVETALWVAGGLKMAITLAWLCWTAQD